MSTESQFYKYNPEKRNIFIEIDQGRKNIVGAIFYGLFMLFASHACAVVEVFLRKKFGERYITMSQSVGLFLFMNFGYYWLDDTFRLRFDGAKPFLFIFTLIYLGLSIYHRMEISKYGTAYDFKRYSLSDGEIHKLWYKILNKKIMGVKMTRYVIHIFLEPAIPIIIGAVLLIPEFSRAVGGILFYCGIIFSLRNFGKAQMGRNWVLDNIDKKITSKVKYDLFINRKPKKDTMGVYLPVELPPDEETRKALHDIVEESYTSTDTFWANDYLDDENKSSDNSDDSAGARGGFTTDNDNGGNGSSGG